MSLARLYPLRGLPHQSRIWSWISFDVANQSFTLLINTLLFSIFFQKVVITDASMRNTWWSVTYGASMLLTVVLSPVFGAISDGRAWKKRCLIASGLTCGALTCMLGLVKPGQLALAMLLYIPANAAYSLGENFLASFLPELAEREQLGRVSAFSWGVAYASALVILVISAVAMKAWGLMDPSTWRPLFVFAGLWFVAFALPTMLYLKERAQPPSGPQPGVLTVGFGRLAESVKNTRKLRDLVTLLFASLLYGTGMSVVVFYASIIAEEFGFHDIELVGFVAVITLSGVIGTLLPMLLQDKLGHKRTTLLLLSIWTVTTLLLAWYAHAHDVSANPEAFPKWPLWVLGNLLGFGLGSLGSANRAFVGFLAPASRTGEVFGLWGLVFKFAAVLTLPFAVVKDKLGTAPSFLVLAAFIVAGFVMTLLVDEERGARAAREVDENGVGIR